MVCSSASSPSESENIAVPHLLSSRPFRETSFCSLPGCALPCPQHCTHSPMLVHGCISDIRQDMQPLLPTVHVSFQPGHFSGRPHQAPACVCVHIHMVIFDCYWASKLQPQRSKCTIHAPCMLIRDCRKETLGNHCCRTDIRSGVRTTSQYEECCRLAILHAARCATAVFPAATKK